MGRRLLILGVAALGGCVSPPWAPGEEQWADTGGWEERCSASWCVDADNDYYGDCDAGTLGIEDPEPEDCAGFAPSDNIDDCDDTNPSIYPYAQERCNGVDDDCDGRIDDNPQNPAAYWYVDADGDGWGDDSVSGFDGCATQPPGASAKGGDCDDGDSQVHPQAFEWNDGTDWNCVEESSDQWPDQPRTVLIEYGSDDYDMYGAFAADDVDGSGRPDLAAGAPSQSLNGYLDGFVHLFFDPDPGVRIEQADVTLHGAPGDQAGGAMALLGAGGGLGAVAIYASQHDSGQGGVYLVSQPSGTVDLATGATSTWRLQDPNVSWRFAMSPADTDGDGSEELVLAIPKGVYLLPQSASGTHTLADASGRLALQSTRPSLHPTLARLDADGDGLEDVVVAASGNYDDEGTVYVVLAPTLATFSTLADADAMITDPTASDARLGEGIAAGDADGDGTPDVLVGAPFWATRGGGLLFLGPLTGVVAASEADATFLGGFGSGYGEAVTLADLDGDGRADPLVSGALFLDAATGAHSIPTDADALVYNLWQRPAAVADFDGDGRDDLVTGDYNYWDSWTSESLYGVGVLMGPGAP